MNELEHQRLWDAYLIGAWITNSRMNFMIGQYISEVAPILAKMNSMRRKQLYLNDKLKSRAPTAGEVGIPVRAFIDRHSKQLSNYLWNNDNNIDLDLVVNSIDNFRWKKIATPDKNARNEKIREKNLRRATVFIEARSLADNAFRTK